jgi:hypothetical protein
MPLPHQSTASRFESPFSSVIARIACPARRSASDESIAFTKRGQHRDRQTFEPVFPVGPFFAQSRLGI